MQFREESYGWRYPGRPYYGDIITPSISWEKGRADVEAAETDTEWLLAALYVEIPPGVGKPYLRAILERTRKQPRLVNNLQRLALRVEAYRAKAKLRGMSKPARESRIRGIIREAARNFRMRDQAPDVDWRDEDDD